MMEHNDTNRILFLDNLRYLMVLLVVVLHSAVSYSNVVPWWCVREANEFSEFFDVLLLILDVFLMPVLFFIAGYFAIPSFQKKGLRLFLRGKLKRLGLPLLIGIPLVSPLFPYIYHYTRHTFFEDMSFCEYWLGYMKGAGDLRIGLIYSADHFNHFHLWFMSLLLFFFILFALYADKKKWHEDSVPVHASENASAKSVWIMLAGVGILSAISAFAGTLIFASPSNPEPWISVANLLQFQPVKVVSYLLCFVMGIHAFYHNWFTKTRIPGHPAIWTISCVVLSCCILILLKQLMMRFSITLLFAYLLARSFLCMSFLCAFTSWAVRCWNRPSHFHSLLAMNSYHIYITHFLIVILLQLLLTEWTDGSVFIKFGMISSGSILISYGISHYAIRPHPRWSVTGICLLFIISLLTVHPGGS